MILDSLETDIHTENAIYAEDSCMTAFVVNYEGIEQGERYLRLPEGLKGLCAGAFASYNAGDVVQNISRMLILPEDSIAEWSKKITGKKLVKITFPPEAGKTVRERATYLVEKEKRVRLLRLHLPATVETIQNDAFPSLLEEITVDEENPHFTSEEGILFSKDRKRLIRYPGYREEECCMVPEGVEILTEGAFCNAFLEKLVLPKSLKRIETGCFKNTRIGELLILEGLQTIETDSFLQCEIGKISLPESVRCLEDYAFRGVTGVKAFCCDSEELSVGVGLFSEGRFDDIDWWPWREISTAAFLNCNLKNITVPEGTETIDDYAFAGCYRAKKIVLPGSVKQVAVHSFDEGDMYSGEIVIPSDLYKFVYRFPALSKVNGKAKSEIWNEMEELQFREERDVLEKQVASINRYLRMLKPFQLTKKKKMEKELNVLTDILCQ